MPSYSFKNLQTGEVYDKSMSIAELGEYLKDPNIQQVLTSLNIVSGSPKPDNGFRDVLKKVKSAHYKSTIDTW